MRGARSKLTSLPDASDNGARGQQKAAVVGRDCLWMKDRGGEAARAPPGGIDTLEKVEERGKLGKGRCAVPRAEN
jgi:hypothetical protein